MDYRDQIIREMYETIQFYANAENYDNLGRVGAEHPTNGWLNDFGIRAQIVMKHLKETFLDVIEKRQIKIFQPELTSFFCKILSNSNNSLEYFVFQGVAFISPNIISNAVSYNKSIKDIQVENDILLIGSGSKKQTIQARKYLLEFTDYNLIPRQRKFFAFPVVFLGERASSFGRILPCDSKGRFVRKIILLE